MKIIEHAPITGKKTCHHLHPDGTGTCAMKMPHKYGKCYRQSAPVKTKTWPMAYNTKCPLVI